MVTITEADEGTPATVDDEIDPYEHLELAPFGGKEFNTVDDAKEFYNSYAYRMGFSIREGGNYTSAKTGEVTSVRHGGKKNLRFKKKDVTNVITSENQQLVDKNVEATIVYFQKKQEEDPEFFYDVEVDEGGQLKNLFWIDGRARRAFQEFGDVVTFDTTYRTNRFCMPLAPFIGVNHHRRCVFFGIAMLRSEHIAGFVWLFKTWVKAMYGKKPRAIITDQDPAMRIAIKEVFPNSVHRCCQWHVMRKAREHLGAIYNLKPDFKKELKRVINHSNTVSEFEEKWRAMLDKHNKEVGTCGSKETQTSEIGTTASRPSNVILDPPVSQCKGKRKKPQRFKPPSEPKKPRKCGICGSTKGGHNSRTCPMKKDGKSKRREEEEVDDDDDDDDEYEDLSS
ncbi:hypothetical protein LUZ63_002983 [Rhynchospora breviuscula]|uniref:MULE transposase domain-containing protein n=1 Tax=Rhynchospora breviuscula TaxID=2022672 RepID=A0A9Q0D157_9POAL|nr:hypothetical protein LUZ63_002983 [Rhynchospora breviuscula]